MIKGIGASSGIAIAKAYKLVMPDLTVTKVTIADTDAEIKNFDEAMSQTAKELESIKNVSVIRYLPDAVPLLKMSCCWY